MQNTEILTAEPTAEGHTEVMLRRRYMDKKVVRRVLPVEYNAFIKALGVWVHGAMIQNAFPMLGADDREFLMTGITPEEWAEMFGEGDDLYLRDDKIMWWGYLHQNGSLQIKRWFGDPRDYTEDCEGNDFVVKVVGPFEADSREHAISRIKRLINN